jgi:hypothetical protein
MLIECLVYCSVSFVILGLGFALMYQCIDNAVVLRRNADDIAAALNAGERWRADVRAADSEVRLEDQTLYLRGSRGEITYRFSENTVWRRTSKASWTRVLEGVKSSVMQPDTRGQVVAWTWEIELQPRRKGYVRPGHVRPLFTFLAAAPPQEKSNTVAFAEARLRSAFESGSAK